MNALNPSVGRLCRSSATLPVGLLFLIAFGTTIIEQRFLGAINLQNLFRNASYLAIVSAGQSLVLIAGGIDLSVGAVVALSSVVTSTVMAGLYSGSASMTSAAIVAGVSAGLSVGLVIGTLNGLAVAYLRASPFILTLGSMSVVSGLAFLLTAGIPIYGMPQEFTRSFGRATFAGAPWPVVIALTIIVALWLVLRRTAIGRHWYATGGNSVGAELSGVSVKSCLVMLYTLSSLLAAAVGVLLTARLGSGQASLGGDLMLQSIAAAMIGGVSLSGGIGRIEIVTLSALLLAAISNSMNLVRVDSKAQTIVLGLVLIVAVLIDHLRSRRNSR